MLSPRNSLSVARKNYSNDYIELELLILFEEWRIKQRNGIVAKMKYIHGLELLFIFNETFFLDTYCDLAIQK